MIGWLKILFGASAAEPPSEPIIDPKVLREEQAEWIRQQLKVWQAAWHDIYDSREQHPEVEERDDPLSEDANHDSRLVFGFGWVTPETRRECFALFPDGDEMYRRCESHFDRKIVKLTEAQARELVAQIGQQIGRAWPNEEVNWEHVEISDEAYGDRISYLFEESLLKPFPPEQLTAVAARLFLTEPLYRQGGSSYELGDWVTGAMFEPERDQIHKLVYRLWAGGWQILVDEDGVVLRRID